MWMTDYIRAIKCKFRDEYGFMPKQGSINEDPVFVNIPDGEYPMNIGGKLDRVRIEGGYIHCCNFD